MTTISKLALAAVLATGVGTVAFVAPAAAAKKEEPKKAGLKLSPDVLKPAQAAQTALTAKDVTAAEPAIAQVEAAAKSDDDKYIAATFRLQLEQMKIGAVQAANPNAPVDQTRLAAPLDALLVNPSTPADLKGRFAAVRGTLAFNGKQYPQAIQYFTQAQQLGYREGDLPVMIVKAKIDSGDVRGGLTDLDAYLQQTSAAGQKPTEEYYKYGLSRAATAKLKPETMTWLVRWVNAYPTAKNWRDAVVVYGLQPNALATLDKGQKLDLFRLLRVNKALADQADFLEYAQYARDKGLPGETQSVIQEGMAAGKIPAGSTSARDFLAEATGQLKAEGSLGGLEAKSRTSASGVLAAGTADAYLSTGNYAKAVELYKLSLTKGGVNADDINTHIGIALARSGDKAGAQAAFASVKTAPRTDIATLWTTWLAQPSA